MNHNIDDLEEFNLEFTTPVNDVVTIEEYKEKLKTLEKLIIPFLDKMMQDPGKDIHWPNRDKVISKMKKKILSITDLSEIVLSETNTDE